MVFAVVSVEAALWVRDAARGGGGTLEAGSACSCPGRSVTLCAAVAQPWQWLGAWQNIVFVVGASA